MLEAFERVPEGFCSKFRSIPTLLFSDRRGGTQALYGYEVESARYCGRCILPGTKRTKNSRQRRLAREDLPLRTPRRGSGKSKPSQQGTSGPDIETIASLRQPPPAARAKDGFGRLTVSAACGADLVYLCRVSLPLSTPSP